MHEISATISEEAFKWLTLQANANAQTINEFLARHIESHARHGDQFRSRFDDEKTKPDTATDSIPELMVIEPADLTDTFDEFIEIMTKLSGQTTANVVHYLERQFMGVKAELFVEFLDNYFEKRSHGETKKGKTNNG